MTHTEINTAWLHNCSPTCLERVLIEYRYFVRRFSQWLALALARCEDERIRQLLLPNLIEETGTFEGVGSHLSLLNTLLDSCGIKRRQWKTVTAVTEAHEQWFYNVVATEGSLEALSVLGPGTEEVSHGFLSPLEVAVRDVHKDRADLAYFDAHRPEIEEHHAEDLRLAIRLLIQDAADPRAAEATVSRWSEKAMATHQAFWDALRPDDE